VTTRPTIDRVLSALAFAAGVVSASVGLLALTAVLATPAHAQPAQSCYPPTPGCGGTTTSSVASSTSTTRRGDGISVSDSTVVAGQVITVFVTAGTYAAGTQGIILFDCTADHPRQIGSFTVAGDGSVTQDVRVPADASPGPHEVCTVGTDRDGRSLRLIAPITVSDVSETRVLGTSGEQRTAGVLGTAGALPLTGSTILLPAAALGLALVVVGVLVRRRTRASGAR
jgi:hypothetical protein